MYATGFWPQFSLHHRFWLCSISTTDSGPGSVCTTDSGPSSVYATDSGFSSVCTMDSVPGSVSTTDCHPGSIYATDSCFSWVYTSDSGLGSVPTTDSGPGSVSTTDAGLDFVPAPVSAHVRGPIYYLASVLNLAFANSQGIIKFLTVGPDPTFLISSFSPHASSSPC